MRLYSQNLVVTAIHPYTIHLSLISGSQIKQICTPEDLMIPPPTSEMEVGFSEVFINPSDVATCPSAVSYSQSGNTIQFDLIDSRELKEKSY